MRSSMMEVLPQGSYIDFIEQCTGLNSQVHKSLSAEHQERMSKLRLLKNDDDPNMRHQYAKMLMKEQIKAAMVAKAGVTSGLGFNFYDLRGPAYLLYPVNTPFVNSMPRMSKVNDGFGTAAHWMATRDFGTVYGGVAEGQRNRAGTPDKIDYIATYKEIGVERAVTFTAQVAGEGYTDNLADEHLRGFHALRLQEESLMLFGNSGNATGNNGFKLATMNTPTGALVTGTGITTARYVSAYVVALTPLAYANNAQYGYQTRPTVAAGLVPSYVRTNADGSQDTINGGTSQISAKSTAVLTTGGTLNVRHTVVPKAGAVAYAWYTATKSADTAAISEHFLTAITTLPTYLQVADSPSGTQTADATGLNADHSFQLMDFDGLFTYAATQGRWVDQLGANFTSDGANGIVEVDADLAYFWDNFQAGVDVIWCSTDVKQAIDKTVLANGGNPSSYRVEYARDSQNNMLAGSVVSAYQSRYSMSVNGGNAIPIRLHPMLPAGCMYYDISTNPYPHSRIPFVRGMMVQRDYYSVEWPVQTRNWTFGTYAHEVLAHNVPWLTGVRAGIGGPDVS